MFSGTRSPLDIHRGSKILPHKCLRKGENIHSVSTYTNKKSTHLPRRRTFSFHLDCEEMKEYYIIILNNILTRNLIVSFPVLVYRTPLRLRFFYQAVFLNEIYLYTFLQVLKSVLKFKYTVESVVKYLLL